MGPLRNVAQGPIYLKMTMERYGHLFPSPKPQLGFAAQVPES